MKNNEKGVTLVELLATVTILSIVGILVWSVFIQGIKHSNKESTKNLLTQEANYVQFSLKKIHQTSEEYQIKFPSPCSIQIEDLNAPSNPVLNLNNNQICYSINDVTNYDDGLTFDLSTTSIKPKDIHHSISFQLILKEKKNERNKVITHTILSRLKEDK